MRAMRGFGTGVRLAVAASLCGVAWPGAHAQELPDSIFYTCKWLDDPVQPEGLGPDYSFVDLMTPSPDLPGAVTWDPICVNVKNQTLEWNEARPKRKQGESVDIKVARRVFFYKPQNSAQLILPLIIWAHPQGDTDILEPGTDAADKVADPAIKRGYAFMSLQYRHPTVSQKYYDPPPRPTNQSMNGAEPPPGTIYPSTDIATAVQWARYHAAKLRIDPLNIFLVSQSRGSLAVLTALMSDRSKPVQAGDPPWANQSSLPNAVFAAQAQTTYRDTQLKSFFINRYASTAVTNLIVAQPVQFPLCREFPTQPLNQRGRFDYHCHYDLATQDFTNTVVTPLSSYDELDASDTKPIWTRYDRTPTTTAGITKSGLYVNDPGDYQDKPDIDDNGDNCFETPDADKKVLKCFDVHHPNFGAKLRLKWQGLVNPLSHVIVQYANTRNTTERIAARQGFFTDYYCFFMQYQPAGGAVISTLTTEGDDKRVASIDIENLSRPANQQIPTDKCTLRESAAWIY
jgi:hypothetical protein